MMVFMWKASSLPFSQQNATCQSCKKPLLNEQVIYASMRSAVTNLKDQWETPYTQKKAIHKQSLDAKNASEKCGSKQNCLQFAKRKRNLELFYNYSESTA